jgi:hypothetical protein
LGFVISEGKDEPTGLQMKVCKQYLFSMGLGLLLKSYRKDTNPSHLQLLGWYNPELVYFSPSKIGKNHTIVN